ncbi:hypothetical protein K1W54_23185 [Micromonospora sp. CPCC 205371]|nr:hypothetical protein [Micromonospora sp. CPCC 205371]
MRGSDRLSLVILVIAAAGVLVLGTWWWVANAPAQPASAEPTPVASSWEPAEVRPAPADVDVRVLVTAPGRRYRLQYVCFGPGSLGIVVQGAEGGTQLREVDCEGSFDEFELTAAGERIEVVLERPNGDTGEVDLRLVETP